jgi:hypothetical protein
MNLHTSSSVSASGLCLKADKVFFVAHTKEAVRIWLVYASP